MKLLLDTHLLLWAAFQPHRLSAKARQLIDNPDNILMFSAASLWEIAIKRSRGRHDFTVDPGVLRLGLVDNAYLELAIDSRHAIATEGLPALHKDPFDRILIAQSVVEGVTLVTADTAVAQYPGPILQV